MSNKDKATNFLFYFALFDLIVIVATMFFGPKWISYTAIVFFGLSFAGMIILDDVLDE